MTSFQTLDDLRREAALAKREEFEQFLKLVLDAPPQAGDELLPNIDTFSKNNKQEL